MKKICFTASTGGHFEQLLMLKPLMKKYNSFMITEKAKYDVNCEENKVYYVKQVNRKELTCIFKLIFSFFKVLKIFLKEKPTHVISTGALSTIPICLAGKLVKAKIIYIESYAKIHSPTLTGKFMYKIADEFIIQWETLKKFYPNATFGGGIY